MAEEIEDETASDKGAKEDCGRTTISRRDLIAGAGTTLVFTILPRHVVGGQGQGRAPSDKLNIAGVGVGGFAANYVEGCNAENIVAFADVHPDYAEPTFKKYPKAKTYTDYRVMLEKEKGIDAVIVGTPDHTHAVIAMAAIELGKHVYVAKPMAHTVHEVRQVTKAARERKLATQMSTQDAGSEAACSTKELLMSGIIGNVLEVHDSTDRPIWPQGLSRPKEALPIPAGLDWDLWIGPAEMRPFHLLYHPFNWRGWYDFGTGPMGDMALHSWQVYWDALELTHPIKVSSSIAMATEWEMPKDARLSYASTGRISARKVRQPESFPHAAIITYEFAARGSKPPMTLYWYEGGLVPPRPAGLDWSLASPSRYYVGEKGILVPRPQGFRAPAGQRGAAGSGGQGQMGARGGQAPAGARGATAQQAAVPQFVLLVNGKAEPHTQPPKTLTRTIGHYIEWCEAAKGGKPAACNFDYASLFAETSLLGVISVRTGRDLVYDSANMRFTNNEDANQYLNPPYRSGWSL